MYNVSEDYKTAIKRPVQYSKIAFTLDGQSYTEDNILSGSFEISNQCTDTSDINLGAVFTAELTATLRGIDLPRNGWVKKTITPTFRMRIAPETYEDVPLGVFTISEATWTRSGVDIVAYDEMAKFDKPFSMNQTAGYLYDFLVLATEACHVALGHTQAEVEAMTNGTIYMSYYADNDVETWRDFIYWCAQITGGFATINRAGELEIRHYGGEPVDELDTSHRQEDSEFSDYITKYTSFSYVDLQNQTTRIVAEEIDDGITMNLGSNPFLQTGAFVNQLAQNLLPELDKIRYVPFKSATIGNPAYDLGDPITFTGGLAGETSEACVMKYVFTYHKEFEIAGFGANPELASAKSKTEKNISGLLNNVKGDQMQFYEYQNASQINIGDQEQRQVFRLKIASTADTRVDIHMNICLETTATDEEPTTVTATYTIDGEPYPLHPEETYIDGKHVLHLMYIMPISANITVNFRLYLQMDGGSAFIDRRGVWVYAGGYGVVGDGKWDGTIDIDEEPDPIPITEPDYTTTTESVDIDIIAVTGRTYTDNAGTITITEPETYGGATEAVTLMRFNTAYERTTEEGDSRITESEDGTTITARYTEEEF